MLYLPGNQINTPIIPSGCISNTTCASRFLSRHTCCSPTLFPYPVYLAPESTIYLLENQKNIPQLYLVVVSGTPHGYQRFYLVVLVVTHPRPPPCLYCEPSTRQHAIPTWKPVKHPPAIPGSCIRNTTWISAVLSCRTCCNPSPPPTLSVL